MTGFIFSKPGKPCEVSRRACLISERRVITPRAYRAGDCPFVIQGAIMMRRVVVTGMGCISPVGNNVKDTWKSLLEGKSGAGMITHFDASRHKTRFAAEVKGFDGAALFGPRDARKMDRFTQFATGATMEALEQSRLKIDESNRDHVGVLIGTGIG